MVEIVTLHEEQKKKTGKPGKVSLKNQVLMTEFYQLSKGWAAL
jgi:hypothetical protein